MNENSRKMNVLSRYLKPWVGLSEYIDVDGAAENIKKSIYFRGPNVYILACAIIIASVGLNVNSIPVIIGAMLISPLMGPIVGMGMALGTYNMRLFVLALKNWGVMVAISIVASTVYFLLSPLYLGNPTELLARTNPTIYDVLIAFFGGFAGIVETSRKEKGTAVAGVAIATALMPPLCTIGFGLAKLNLHYALGALYLFFINSIFIATAAFLGAKYLGFPAVKYDNEAQRRKISRTVIITIIIFIIPSIFSAVTIVRQNNFDRSVAAFVEQSKVLGYDMIYDTRVVHNGKDSHVELLLTNDDMDPTTQETLYVLAGEQGIERSQIAFNTNALGRGPQSDGFMADLYNRSQEIIKAKDHQIDSLQQRLSHYNANYDLSQRLGREVPVQYPSVQQVAVAQGADGSAKGGDTFSTCTYVIVRTDGQLAAADRQKLHDWLKVRMQDESLKLIVE